MVRKEAEEIAGLPITDEEVPFGQLGFSSVKAVALVSRLGQLCGRELPVSLLFDHPTLGKLTDALMVELATPAPVPAPAPAPVAASNGHAASETETAPADEPIALIGIGCRFPGGADDPERFWRLLEGGQDASGEIPAERWNQDVYFDSDPGASGKAYVRRGAFLGDVRGFDAEFFGLMPREAEALDPQQRLLLEVAWEALEHAGLPAEKLRESATGVFVGISGSEYGGMTTLDPEVLNQYSLTGTIHSTAAGRLSYTLGLNGPCLAVDTACSSSLVSVHLAVQSLRRGESKLALAGGVNLLLSPGSFVGLSRLQALSPDGRCKTFDESADGYGRGEGAGVVVLKRLSDAERDGDRVIAVIRGTAVNHDGRSSGLTVPNGVAQEAVIRAALQDAGVEPASVSYLEAHGTGTRLGDPQEMRAIAHVYGEQRPAGAPLHVGSVKTNIGHLESAAGVAGLCKVALSLSRGRIPAHLHLRTPSTRIPWANIPVKVPRETVEWNAGTGPRRGAVSSFGLSGTNAHVVLEEYARATPERATVERPVHLLTLSARDEKGVRELVAKYTERLASVPASDVANLCYTANAGRVHQPRRQVVIGANADELRSGLERLARLPEGRLAPDAVPASAPPCAWLFTGQGSQRIGMGRVLYDASPVFRAALDECAAILDPLTGTSLVATLYGEEPRTTSIDDTIHAQPAIVAVEIALARLWLSWGLKPQMVAGHSVGEFAAAHVAGALSLEDALRLVAHRGRLMQALPERGVMATISTGEATVREVLASLGSAVAIAAVNAPDSVVISGREAEMVGVLEALSKRNIQSRRLVVSHAFHSPLMAPMVEEFGRAAAGIRARPATIPFFSTVTGQRLEQAPDAEYWRRQIIPTVRFCDTARALYEAGARVFLEIGPAPILSSLGPRCVTEPGVAWLHSLAPREDGWRSMLTSLGVLYMSGAPIQWKAFDAPYHRHVVDAPTYPFRRTRFWSPAAAAPSARGGARMNGETAKPAAATEVVAVKTATPVRQRAAEIRSVILDTVAESTGAERERLDTERNVFEMGLDSLVLFKVRQALERGFGIQVPVSAFYQEASTIERMVAYVDAALPPEVSPEPEPTPAPRQESAPEPVTASRQESAPALNGVERIVSQQLQIMEQQLALLSQVHGGTSASTHREPTVSREPTKSPVPTVSREPTKSPVPAAPPAAARVAAPAPQGEVFVAYKRIANGPSGDMDGRQKAFLETLIRDFTARTPGSKRVTDASRPVLANNRAVAGFRPTWKEMVYPLQVERAEGSRVWDVDGNSYIDLTMGFGVYLFGHNPPFIRDAVTEALRHGAPLGPMTPMPGQVAELLREHTGVERAAFYNSGTEAVMVALRLARTVTGRSKVVIFSGSYHGSFDGILAAPGGGTASGVPVCPGTTPNTVGDIIVLPYGTPESLEQIRGFAGDLAAVLVEPVQSRRPDLQPQDFLHELRRITRDSGTALIFDEVITGFRIGPGGSQAHFGVRADLATYGKIIGGGMPIGVVAGNARFMDAVDGGAWRFGDDSYPKAQNTFVAGTFCHHPAAMAAAMAVLQRLREEGPVLQEQLNHRTAALVDALNDYCTRRGAPVRLVHFGSLFRFQVKGDWELLYYRLLCKGLYVWEGRNCFLSTAHTDEDVRLIRSAVEESIEEMMAAGFGPPEPNGPGPRGRRPEPTPVPRPGSEPVSYPMSSAQRRMYTLSQLEGGERAYHLYGAMELEGTLDEARLEECFRQLIDRHESLRTSFTVDANGSFLQRVHPSVAFALERGSCADEAELVQRFVRPFRLSEAPLIRLGVFLLGDGRRVLALDAHHAVVDGMSLTTLFQELVNLYLGQPLGPAPRQCREHAAWEEAFLRTGAAVQERYWLERLSGELPGLPLASDSPRPPRRSFEGGELRLSHPAAALRERAQERGASLYMVLLAAYKVLLQRLTGQRETVVGTAHAGRQGGGFDGSVGMFVNSLPVRTLARPGASFVDFLDEVKQRCLETYEHQELPFDLLAQRLGATSKRGHNPLFETMFSYERADGRRIQLPGLSMREMFLPKPTSLFDFSLDVIEEQGTLHLRFEYASALFQHATIERHARSFVSILEEIALNPARPLEELASAGQEPLVPVAAGEPLDERLSATLPELFERQVEARPEHPAIIQGRDRLTYAQLDQWAGAIAWHLRETLKLAEGTVVGVSLPRGLKATAAQLGILKAGGVYLPLETALPEERLRYMIEDSGCAAILTDAQGMKRLGDGAGKALVDVGGMRLDGPAPRVERNRKPEDAAYIIYTSGSTGMPKGVECHHRGLINTTIEQIDGFQIDGTSRGLQFASLAFDASMSEVWTVLAAGATLVVAGRDVIEDPQAFTEYLAEQEVTVATLPPVYLSALGRHPLPTLKTLITAGEAPNPEDARFYASSKRYLNAYGPTECSVCVTMHEVKADGDYGRGIPVGRPLRNVGVVVMDEALNALPMGTVGEVCVTGLGVAHGYVGKPELTREKFVEHPKYGRLYRTGDLGRWREDGELEYVGRRDGQVKIRGQRVELDEVRRTLLGHEAVQEAGVVDWVDGGSKELAAFVVAKGAVSEKSLRRWLGERLPAAMVPARVRAVESLPLTNNGKVDKAALRRLAETGVQPPVPASEAPRATEPAGQELCPALFEVSAEVLRVPSVGPEDGFFELGGDSIKAIQLVARLAPRGVSLEVRDVMNANSFRELAGLVARRSGTGTEEVPPEAPLAPMQAWFFSRDFAEPHHWNQALMLHRPQRFDVEKVREVLGALLSHHDALRMSFPRGEDGETFQRLATPVADFPLEVFELRGRPDARERLEEASATLQRSLRLEGERLVAAGLFRLDEGDRLLIAIHHLVVDGVSWRILLEDFASGYQALVEGRALELPAKTAAFTRWASLLEAHVLTGGLESERGYWHEVERAVSTAAALPRDGEARTPTEADAATFTLSLEGSEVEGLESRVAAAWRANTGELLMAAVAAAVGSWTGGTKVALQVEGHGRESLVSECDITRTVGWFTAMYPVVLDARGSEDVERLVMRTRDTLRGVPHGGAGYRALRHLSTDGAAPAREPEITFNYLGSFERDFSTTVFSASLEGVGPTVSPAAERMGGLEIDAMLVEGGLTLSLRYDRREFHEETIRALAERLRGWIGRIVAQGRARAGTRSEAFELDHPGLSNAACEELLRTNGLAPAAVQAIRALSPMQTSMLFDSLLDTASNGQQLAFSLSGEVDTQALAAAARALSARHEALRTRFFLVPDGEPAQVVLREPRMPLEVANAASDSALEAIRERDRTRGFDLAKDPLTRLTLVRQGPGQATLLMTSHHIITDGWCLGILLGELLRLYAAARRGEQARLEPAPSYGAYVRWLLGRNERASLAWWAEQLAGYERPVGLARRTEPSSVQGQRGHTVHLSPDTTARLRALATSCRVTLSTLLQTLWGVVLAHSAGTEDVAFGLVVSGRPPEVPRVEEMVGLFINTVPARLQVERSATLRQALQSRQARALASEPHHFCALAEVQALTPLRNKLLTHAFAFENYPLERSLLADAEREAELRITGVQHFSHDTYDLVLAVTATESLELAFTYNAAAHEDAVIREAASLLQALCEGAEAERTLGVLEQQAVERLRGEAERVQVAPPQPEPEEAGSQHTAPRTQLEERIARVWRNVLDQEDIGVDDDFSELGGHSLKAMRVVGQLAKELGIPITVRDLFNAPTIAGLARLAERRIAEAPVEIPLAPVAEDYEPSDAQRRFWALERMDGPASVYLISGALMLDGALDVEALRRTFTALVARHEPLRTSFHEVDGAPRQRIHAGVELPIELVDLTGASLDDARVREQVEQVTTTSFDLTRAPLMRVRLLRLAPARHLLVLSMHHIISDGWSVAVLARELTHLYACEVSGRTPSLPPLRIDYKDYSTWLLARLAGPEGDTQRRYWQEKLKDAPPALDLPADHPRPPVRTYRGGSVSLRLPAGVTAELERLARSQGATLFMALVASTKALLYRYTGQKDLVVGTTIAGRTHPDVANHLGAYINLLVLRDSVRGSEGFSALLGSVRQTASEAYDHADYPFDRLVRELDMARDASRSPLFDVMVVHQNNERPVLEMEGVTVTSQPLPVRTSAYDLSFEFSEEQGELACELHYNADLFDQARIRRLGEHWQTLTSNLVAAPSAPLDQVAMLTQAERALLGGTFERVEVPGPRTLTDVVRERVAREPEALAVVCGQRRLTLGELDRGANQLARRLLEEQGLRRGQVVAVVAPRSERIPMALVGVLKAGGVYLPIEADYPLERVRFILGDSKAAVVLADARWAGLLADSGTPVIELGSLELDGEAGDPGLSVEPDEVAALIYTSGSTGVPKAVMMEHRGILNTAREFNRLCDVGPDGRIVQFASLAFDAALLEMAMSLTGGAPLVVAGREVIDDTAAFTAYLEANQASFVILPPVYLSALERHPLPTVKTLVTAGEAANPEDARFYARTRRYINAYGPAECSVCVSMHEVKVDGEYSRGIPVGRPLRNVGVMVADEALNALPVGVVGEVCATGVGVARGYLGREELTREKFVEHPEYGRVYRTGDLGRWREDGELEFVGRRDGQVKIRGQRVELEEVRRRLLEHEAVEAAAVLVREGKSGKELAAFVVARSEAAVPVGELRGWLARVLPASMVPASLRWVEALPLTSNGKVDKAALLKLEDVQEEEFAPGDERERTEAEQVLASAWEEVLGKPRVGLRENYFELGGDSIKAIRMAARLREQGWKVEVREVFMNPTVEQLAPCMKREEQREEIREPAEGEVELTPVQQWFASKVGKEYRDHFNNAALLRMEQGRVEAGALRRALEEVGKHHDALRLRWSEEEGGVKQRYAPLEATAELGQGMVEVELKGEEWRKQLEQEAEKLQGSLSLEKGPVARAGLFRTPEGDRVLWVVHHVAVDAVSWPVLVEDLAAAYRQSVEGAGQVVLPARSDSFQAWSQALRRYAEHADASERAYWAEVDRALATVPPLPDEGRGSSGRNRDSSTLELVLPAEPTRQLLEVANHAYNTRTDELVLVALARALQEWSGSNRLALAMEGHGRAPEVAGNLDVTRTVGWFTCLYPLVLALPASGDVGHHIKQVKESLRAVPSQGVGYGVLHRFGDMPSPATEPRICFNYVGEIGNETWPAPFGPAAESTGTSQHLDAERLFDLELLASVASGSLRVALSYDTGAFGTSRMQALVDALHRELELLIAHCVAHDTPELTPSDIDYSGMSIDELDAVMNAISGK
ncbi:amino acid adenylation domain-containing protein [Archangium gephyra]